MNVSLTRFLRSLTLLVSSLLGAGGSLQAITITGAGTLVGSDIVHPNGNIYDQVLLTGTSVAVTADSGQISRTSFIDLTDDIVQVEFSGPGVLAISLANSSGPAVATKYNQPGVQYMKGHATVTITGATENTYLSIFSVGTMNAVNQTLFKAGEVYDGIADLALVALSSDTNRFGGLFAGNLELFATSGSTGINAPDIRFGGPINLYNVSAFSSALPLLLTGAIDSGQINITGGDLKQDNGQSISFGTASKVVMTAGMTSAGVSLPAKTNQGVLVRAGTDVTATVVQNPATAVATITSAAQAFLATLSTSQQSSAVLTWSMENVRKWSNLPVGGTPRNGIAWGNLTTAQKTAAQALLSAALSSAGVSVQQGEQAADDYLASAGGGNGYGSGLYWVAIYDTPSTSSSWGLQFTGHHLTYNFTYNATYKSGTPLFLGVEPRTSFTVNSTTYDPMATQRTAASDLFTALASYSSSKLSGTYSDILFGANGTGSYDGTYPKSYPTSSRGALYSALSSTDQEKVQTFIRAYVTTQTDEIAEELLGIYLSDTALASTYVAYAGTGNITTTNSYLRVDGPRLWIEFSVQGGVIIRNEPHYHTIWRDKVGDYGGKF
ncbi:MAG: DUF3500 domain-containing protein [Opitutaceae bacterium]|nr:DUF3500 domain-containing protein [Opitutaceae bacterium]